MSTDGGDGGNAGGSLHYCYGTGGGGGGGFMRFAPDGVALDRMTFHREGGAPGRTWDETAGEAYSCAGTPEYPDTYGAVEGGPGANHFGAFVLPGTPMPIGSLPSVRLRLLTVAFGR